MEPIATFNPAIAFPEVTPITPIFFIGDSNVLAYHNLLLNLPTVFAQPIVTTAYYAPSLSVNSLFANGAIEARVRAFIGNHVLADPRKPEDFKEPDLDIAFAREFGARFAVAADDEWSIPRDATVVLMVGTIDLLSLVSEIGPVTDFLCDDPDYVSEAFPHPNLPIVPRDAVVALIEKQLAPLAPALRALRALGIENLYLHALHPPTLDDREYCMIRGAVCSAKLRYKTTVEINRIFRRTALTEDVGFLDLWKATTLGGTLDPRFRLDGDHLNRAAAKRTLETLLTHLASRLARPTINS